MKSFIILTLAFSASAHAGGYLSTEILTCTRATETLSVQILTEADGSPNHAVGTFIDYKKNGVTAYSSSSYDKPKFVPVGGGVYSFAGLYTEKSHALSVGYEAEYLTASLVKYKPGTSYIEKVIFTLTDCKYTEALWNYKNIGNPPRTLVYKNQKVCGAISREAGKAYEMTDVQSYAGKVVHYYLGLNGNSSLEKQMVENKCFCVQGDVEIQDDSMTQGWPHEMSNYIEVSRIISGPSELSTCAPAKPTPSRSHKATPYKKI